MNNANNIIEIRNLRKSYDNGRITALNGLDLEVKKGEFISIMGPSGSGKSTLLNMIGALDKGDEGQINVANLDLMQTKDLSKFRSKEIGFVFQLHNLIPNLTVLENVQIPMYGTKVSGRAMEERAMELLRSVDLTDKIKQKPNTLSGGERQRVAIARALVNHPSIILADEPTGALDSKTGDNILRLLQDLHQKENVTLVMVTHEPYVAEMADRIVNMLDGKIAEKMDDTDVADHSKNKLIRKKRAEKVDSGKEYNIIETDNDLVNIFTPEKLKLEVNYKEKRFKFRIKPIKPGDDLSFIDKIIEHTNLNLFERKIIEKKMKGYELTKAEAKILEKIEKTHKSNLTSKDYDKLLAQHLTPPDFGGNLEKRLEFWSEADFVLKSYLADEIIYRLSADDLDNTELFPNLIKAK